MRRTVRLAEFARLSPREKESTVAEIAAAARARPNGELALVQARVRSFERRYEMPSAVMREQLSAGKLRETEDVVSWLMDLELLDLARGAEARP